MSDSSESEIDYEVLLQKNLERKRALLAELGLDNLLKEGRQLFSETRNRIKPRQPVRRKSVFEEKPTRRSVRIQKKLHRVKYVKGFRGFRDFNSQESSDDNKQSNVEPSDSLSSRGCNSQNVDNHLEVQFLWHSKFATKPKHAAHNNDLEHDHHKQREHSLRESKVQEEENGDGNLYVEKADTEENTSLGIVKKMTAPDQKKIESNMYDPPRRDNYGSEPDENEICEVPVVKNSESFSENIDCTLRKEKLMKTVDKTCVLNNQFHGLGWKPVTGRADALNNNNNLLEHVGDNEGIEWNYRSEEICKQLILKYMKTSDRFKNLPDEETDSEDDWSKYENVMFCISTSEDSDDSVDDSNDDVPRSRRRMSHPHFSYDVPKISCEDVTEEMIANIANRSSCKIYDQLNGTTCHQCRQKTFDTKSVCRSGRCVGVRGMFCGICLPKRYGEQVADVLKNPDWECPVCRGICNCSFCRARAGKNPTGIMYPEARQQGYNCVAEYLKDNEDKENTRTKERKLKILK